MKHTPGPWVYSPAINYHGFSIAPKGILPTLAAVERCGDNKMSVECFNFPGDTEANAKLIAAAPELLEACEHIMNNLIQESPEVWEHEIEHLKYAIKKAE